MVSTFSRSEIFFLGLKLDTVGLVGGLVREICWKLVCLVSKEN